MNAASGDADKGGDKTLMAAVEGLSLEMLCVLDLEEPGLWKAVVISGDDRDVPVSNGEAMLDIIAQARARRACSGEKVWGLTINSRV